MNKSCLTDNYNRFPVSFTHGEGVFLYDADGRAYLDFNSGIAVNALGHGHPHLLEKTKEQMGKLWHVSNLYEIPGQQRLAERLVQTSFADRVFFCNSGAEAIEAMLKLARRYYFLRDEPQKWQVITVSQAFHGRTFATLSAANNETHLHGFGERMPGFKQVAFGNGNLLRQAIDDSTAAILMEPIQGEGGMRAADLHYLQELRQVADEYGLLLLLDEVQCGNGRSGKLWAHQWAEIEPDIMATAKGLGGGFPIGAMLAKQEVASALTAGSHGSTFGGNPLAMAAGNAVLDVLLGDGFLAKVCQSGEYMWGKASELLTAHPNTFKSQSGAGLMQGLQCCDGVEAKDIIGSALQKNLLLVAAGNNTVRLLPPLIVEQEHIDSAFAILHEVADNFNGD